MKHQIQLSDHFNFKKIIRFTLPSIAMMVFTSIYSVVDGLFVSNFVGKTPFAAVTFIFPLLTIVSTVGFLFGAGGSALISKTFGQGNREKANKLFSLIVYTSFIIGVILSALGLIFLRPIASIMGAEGELLENCVVYGRIIMAVLPLFILQVEFQTFFITAEKPKLGLAITVGAGIMNMILDALFIVVFKLGLAGAAMATAISQALGGLVPLIYFFGKNKSLLRLGKTRFDGKALLKTITNGSSELMTNIATSLVGILYNIQLLKYAGENGVAAYGVLMYLNFIFIAIFYGYSMGIAPVIGYHFGANNTLELKNILKKSFILLGIASIVMLGLGEGLSYPLSNLFAGYDKELLELTHRGFMIFSFSFLFAGVGIFGSALFTALNNGLISALISFMRTLVFQVAAILLLPLVLQVDGIWLSIVVAESAAAIVAIICIIARKSKYHY